MIQGDIDEVLAEAKTVPGGVNATGAGGLTPLMVAVLRLNLPMVKALLAAGANPNGDVKQVPLRTAVRAKNLIIAKTLLEAGANPNGLPGSEPPLSKAALIDYFEAVDLLLQAGAWVAAPPLGETAAMTAAEAHNMDMVNYLLDHGASLWASGQLGETVPNFGVTICQRANNGDPECDRLIARVKAAHYPRPPPT